jgi:hypothetical protein
MNEVTEKPNVLASEKIGESSIPSSDLSIVSLLNGKDLEREIGPYIDRLSSDRESWEASEFATSNDRLYGLLMTCYSLNNTMVGSDTTAKSLRKGLAAHIEQKRYTFTDSTPLMTKIVRCIFGVDRRRVNVYASALRIAKEQKIGAMELPRWLKAQGGVEEVKRAPNAAKKAKTLQERVKEGSFILAEPTLGKVHTDALNAQFSTENLSEGVVLLATRDDDGGFSIRRLIQTDSVVKAAIAACAQLNASDKKRKELEAEAAALDKARMQALQNLKVA